MTSPAGDAAWATLLPEGAALPPGGAARLPQHWRARFRALRSQPAAGPGGSRAYIGIPSRERPLIVASCDAAVLRYLADAVLSVPPGTGPVLSLLLTTGLKLFRYRLTWMLAAALRAGSVVVTDTTGGTR